MVSMAGGSNPSMRRATRSSDVHAVPLVSHVSSNARGHEVDGPLFVLTLRRQL
jgi:hypothetical protein